MKGEGGGSSRIKYMAKCLANAQPVPSGLVMVCDDKDLGFECVRKEGV